MNRRLVIRRALHARGARTGEGTDPLTDQFYPRTGTIPPGFPARRTAAVGPSGERRPGDLPTGGGAARGEPPTAAAVEAERHHLAQADRLPDLDAWIEARAEADDDETGELAQPDFEEPDFGTSQERRPAA